MGMPYTPEVVGPTVLLWRQLGSFFGTGFVEGLEVSDCTWLTAPCDCQYLLLYSNCRVKETLWDCLVLCA